MKETKGMLLGLLLVNLGIFASLLIHPLVGGLVVIGGVAVFAFHYMDGPKK